MPPQPVLSPTFKRQCESLRILLQRCLALTEQCGEAGATALLRDRLAHVESAALFVIVGEVKSGKSSFVNALLGEEVCEVAPDPCTMVIQEISYGEQRSRTSLGEQWERIRLPKPSLREITIVDTPGINSVIPHHQTITEQYIPRSDLVIYVLLASNPHRGSEWDLLSRISKEWHRKTVFVLQQADRASQHELDINVEKVKQYARERGVQAPLVFPLSAKRESEEGTDAGFAAFRHYLRQAVESGDVWRMKLEGGRNILRKTVADLLARLRKEQSLLAEDNAFYQDLLGRLEARRRKANSLTRLVVNSLCAVYDRLSSRLEADFSEGLGVGTILRRALPLIRDKDVKTWLKDLHVQFERAAGEEIEAESSRVSKDLSDEMQALLLELGEAVAGRQNGQRLQSRPIASARGDILETLGCQLRDLRVADVVSDKEIQGSDLGRLTLAGGGLAALGTVIALATHLIAFDITGGILAAVGAGLVAVTLLWKRSSILREFSQRLAHSQDDFRGRLDREITLVFDRIFLEIEHDLRDPLTRIESETARVGALIEEAVDLNGATEAL